MADFSHLRKLDVNEDTLSEYVFDDIPGNPSIWCRPMTDGNKAFMNARVRVSIERAERDKEALKERRSRESLTTDRLEEDREIDRKLIADTVAVRWGKAPRAADGSFPEFSKEVCAAFLGALPNYMLDPFRNWLSNPYNFVSQAAIKEITEAQAEDMGNALPND